MTRKLDIFVEEEKKYEVITEKVDKVPGSNAEHFEFPGKTTGVPGKEGTLTFRLYVVPQERLGLHRCFVRSLSLPSY